MRESNVALTFGGVGHFQRNPGKAFSTRQAGRAPAPVGEEGRRWSGPFAAHSPPPIGVGVDPLRLLGEKPSRPRKKAPYRQFAKHVHWVSGIAVPSLPQRLAYFASSCFAISQLLGNSNATACALRLISACPTTVGASPPMPILARNARVRSCVPQGFIYTYTDYLVFCRCLTSLHP